MTSVVHQPPLAPLSRLDTREPVTWWTCVTDMNDFLIMDTLFCFASIDLNFKLTILPLDWSMEVN